MLFTQNHTPDDGSHIFVGGSTQMVVVCKKGPVWVLYFSMVASHNPSVYMIDDSLAYIRGCFDIAALDDSHVFVKTIYCRGKRGSCNSILNREGATEGSVHALARGIVIGTVPISYSRNETVPRVVW